MKRLAFAGVADDDTGASDLAGMLAEERVRTLLVIDLPAEERFLEWSAGYDAIVMAEGTRNLSVEAARGRTLRAVRLLKLRDPHLFQIKYCSTFDSTPEGNIGPAIDAALDELEEDFTIALAALPVNGRTTYQGHHFVGHELLSDSPMRHHPLTPMTNSNLVDLLGQQTRRRVGLASYSEVEAGEESLRLCFERLRAEGVGVAVVDCLNDRHLETICRASMGLRLLTGSSAFGIKLPALLRERGWITEETDSFQIAGGEARAGSLIAAGSCSTATLAQNSWLASQGVPAARIRPDELLAEEFDRTALVANIREHLAAGRDFLLTTSGTPEEVRSVQAWGAQTGRSVSALGEAISYAMADLLLEILEGQRARGLVVAGGETSGAVCRRLELGALRVGRNIEPGVPLCFSLGRFRLAVALKSGNFGSRDFYARALRAISEANDYF